MFSKLSELINKPRPLIRCPHCRKMVSRTADKCPKCGGIITPENVAKADKNQVTANKVGLGCGVTFAVFFLLMIIAGLAMPDPNASSNTSDNSTHSNDPEAAQKQIARQAGFQGKTFSKCFVVDDNGITPINLLTNKSEKCYWFRYGIIPDFSAFSDQDIHDDIFEVVSQVCMYIRNKGDLDTYESLYFAFQLPDSTGTMRDCVEISIPTKLLGVSMDELDKLSPQSIENYIAENNLFKVNF